MVHWHKIVFREFEDDEGIREKLYHHRLLIEEVIECFYNHFLIRRNKKFKDRFQLIGKTNHGRRLKIIFQLKPKDIVRIITAWDL